MRWAVAAGVIAFAVYVLTLAPDVYWEDSGELITAAYTLGIAHHTGYPLYVMTGKLFSLIPAGSIAYRLNLMSAFFAAGTVALIYLCARRIMERDYALLAALAFAFSRTFWGQATFAEVYTLNSFLMILAVYLLFTLKSRLYLVALTVGLGAANHVMILLIIPGIAYYMIAKGKAARPWMLILFFILGLLPYIYLPLRSAQNPVLDWGNPETPGGFIRLVGARDIHGVVISRNIGQNLSTFITMAMTEFSVFSAFILLSVAGRKRRELVFLWINMIVYSVAFVVSGVGGPAYIMPATAMAAILLAAGTGRLISFFSSRIIRLSAVVLVILVISGSNYRISDKQGLYYPRTYAENILSQLPENAIIITNGDYDTPLLWYLQHVEGKRRDVSIIDRILLTKPWYVDQIEINASKSRLLKDEYTNTSEARLAMTDMIAGIITANPKRDVYLTYGEDIGIPYRPIGHVLSKSGSGFTDLTDSYKTAFDAELDPMSRKMLSRIFIFHGIFYFGEGSYSKAEEKFLRATWIDPQNAMAFENLGGAYYMAESYLNAEKAWARAAELDPENQKTRQNLAGLRIILAQKRLN
ncbi:MAG: DUF2723 domain-containing protein [archaeon]